MEQSITASSPWPRWQKTLFRFFFLFFTLNLFPFPANMYPEESFMDSIPFGLWGKPAQWLATHVFHLPGELLMKVTGSGDMTFHWIQWLLFVILSLAGMVVWSFFDRTRPDYRRLHQFFRVYLRYYLAFMMLLYGTIKVFYLQMPPPRLFTLMQPYGSSSPMGVLWNFIGSSEPYSIFCGMSEMLGGMLLLFRRTTLLGAIVSAGVMFHVFVLNMCYDVPVKLFSFLLVMVAVFLAAPGFSRLADFFFSKKMTRNDPDAPLFSQKKWAVGATVLKWAVVAWIFYANISTCLKDERGFAKPPLYGIYDVRSMERNRHPVPPLRTDSSRWQKMIVTEWPGRARVTMANDSIEWMSFEVDTATHQIKVTPRRDTVASVFGYTFTEPDLLTMSGLWKNDSLLLHLKRYDERRFLLNRRGFHWVNEYPFNR